MKDNLKTLLSMGAKHIKSARGYYPIHAAILNNHFDIVKEFVSHGANINIKSKYGLTPLHYASGYGVDNANIDLITYLIKNGAKHDILAADGLYPIHRAVYNNHIDIVKELVSHGVNINMQSKNGMTPLGFALFYAGDNANIDLLTYLYENGTQLKVKYQI
eukprot:GHVL01003002.1.p1 GENE.GHVL01003002.1~~GHVL01003002.1.p1  ORF type:complete len:176 (-),score=24.46 GHVL01003002.1:463-945(-)